MKRLIILVIFALVFKLGASHLNPVGKVTCNNNHTVDINITNIGDVNEWNTSDWRLQSKAECEPTFGSGTVTYSSLKLPECSWSSEQLAGSIKYILKVNPTKTNRSGNGQLRGYDHLYYVSCEYDNQNRSSASFVPIKNREDNDSSTAFFSFNLRAFYFPNHTGEIPNPIELKTTLYFQASVETQSAAPNLDLFPVSCWSSKSSEPGSTEGKFILITAGCGNKATSEDLQDTLSYTCTNDSITEHFSIQTFRYFGAAAGDAVFFHCDLRVCLADKTPSTCDCPSVATCNPAARKKRSTVDETKLYHVSTGPFIFESDGDKEEEKETGSGDQNESQAISTNTVIAVAVSGVLAVAILCTTAYLVVRSRNKRRQHGVLHVAS